VLLPGRESQTLSVVVSGLASNERFTDYGLVTATSVFYVIPVMVIFGVSQRYLMNIFSGGVKG